MSDSAMVTALRYLEEHAPAAGAVVAVLGALAAALPKLSPYMAGCGAWLLRVGDQVLALADRMRDADPARAGYFRSVSALQRQLDRVGALPEVVRVVLVEARFVEEHWRVWVHQQAPDTPDVVTHWQDRRVDDDYVAHVLTPILGAEGITEGRMTVADLAEGSELRTLYESDGIACSVVRRLWRADGHIWYCSINTTAEDIPAPSKRVMTDALHAMASEMRALMDSGG